MKDQFVILLVALLFLSSPTTSCMLCAPEPGTSSPPRQESAQQQDAGANQGAIKSYSGKIAKSNGKYVLQDIASSNSYLLDDQKSAKTFSGKMVLVTGTLDAKSNTIHVKKISLTA